MQQAPVILARKRVLEAMTQEPHAVCVFQLIDGRRIPPKLSDVQFHGVRVLFTATDEQLFFLPPRLKHRNW